MSKTAACLVVRETLLACLPPGVPPSFKSVDSAAYEGRGRSRTITARLTMLDGLMATVQLTPWAFGWSHRFTDLPGGALSFEDSSWRRVACHPSFTPEPNHDDRN